MSYSIFTLFANEKDQQAMQAFLSENFRPMHEMVPPDFSEEMRTVTPLATRDLAYVGDFTEPLLGFDYGSGDSEVERGYRFALCYWMAAIAGKKENGRGLMVYDGEDIWTVCPEGSACDCPASIHTDAFGARKIGPLLLAETMSAKGADLDDWIVELKTVNQRIQDEMKRLTELWNEKHPNQTQGVKKIMPLIPLFKPYTREQLTKDFDLDFGLADWVQIEFPYNEVESFDDNLDPEDFDPGDTVPYETNRYDATCYDNQTGKTLSVYIYMDEDSEQVIAIDSVVQDHAVEDARYAIKDTPIGDIVEQIKQRDKKCNK